jgi:membrane-associated HD superfamily phosphohydrolase
MSKVQAGLFIREGKPTALAVWLTTLLAIIAVVLVVFFRLNNWFGWTVIMVATIAVFVSGTAAHAAALGIKPFTNDPLGWRKAKASYKGDHKPGTDSKPD